MNRSDRYRYPAQRTRRALLATAALLAASAGCMPQPAPAPAIPVSNTLNATFVVDGANQPRALAVTSDGRLFYGEKSTGAVRIVTNGQLLEQPFAVVPVNFAGERGLLDLALHPNFAQNNRIYLLYTRSDSANPTDNPLAVVDLRVVYFEAAGNQAAATEVFVATIPLGTLTTQVGGRIAFGADGTLFVAVGDQGDAALSQDPASRLGKILRYNDDGSIPADNPDPTSPAFALGLRDPRGLALDPVTGDIFAADRNPTGFQEVNRIRLARNFGWPAVIGFAKSPTELAFANATADYTDPLLEEPTVLDLAGASFNPSGKYGPRQLEQLLISDGSSRNLYTVELNGTRTAATSSFFAGPFPTTVTALTFSPAGTLFVATEAAIFRIDLRS